MNDELLTTAQVAALTGWSVAKVNRWADAGKLPVHHQNPGRTGAKLYRLSDVQAIVPIAA